jgi:hypothetical protein
VGTEVAFSLAFSLVEENDAFSRSGSEAYQRTSGRCGVLDRIPDFGVGKRFDSG